MIWEYSPSPNKYNLQFLLPPEVESEVVAGDLPCAQAAQLTDDEQEALQKLCCEFLSELGYSVTHNGTSQAEQLLADENPLTIQTALDMMHSFAFCVALREQSMRPFFIFNTLMANVYKLHEQL